MSVFLPKPSTFNGFSSEWGNCPCAGRPLLNPISRNTDLSKQSDFCCLSGREALTSLLLNKSSKLLVALKGSLNAAIRKNSWKIKFLTYGKLLMETFVHHCKAIFFSSFYSRARCLSCEANSCILTTHM